MKSTAAATIFACAVNGAFGRLTVPSQIRGNATANAADPDVPLEIPHRIRGNVIANATYPGGALVFNVDIRTGRKLRKCGGGQVGSGACADSSLCCSEWGWCGTSAGHCAGVPSGPETQPNTDPRPDPEPENIVSPGGGGDGGGDGGDPAYLTYHMYYKRQPLTELSCSDGANGLITRWGYDKIRRMWPYVAAVSNLQWNSPVCGTCYELYAESTGNTVYVTAVDKVALPGENGELHFDMSKPSFDELLGEDGYRDGHGYSSFREVDSSKCKGNKG
mmetsp:Transcript_4306/g.12009  ORF Transcript_4306/g.12009 Transcript_4306/m.12009 type:complete len:276 (-) Transcript_4306:380-1207(-)|eukprot:CAMPEP_0113550212 /NCGR_PEP_ID=MMETSP0015_2-20120614/13861_1 /TAXON_ID=2838 /ORGANISM="Odontella" /LENGTH=275 /DNA_ID=CAMNT_0000451003 /DNA_START=207 /DNA_END=1034 /DNA_ORIENTATION=- /assembly_acc=CAM_ASM_000160